MTKRNLLVALGALAVVAATVTVARRSGDPQPFPDDAPTLDAMATDIGGPVMGLLHRGHVPGRSGDLVVVAKPHNFLNRLTPADFEALGTARTSRLSSHPNPWNYITRVPVILYRPGFIPEGIEVPEPVDITGMAATYGQILGVDGFEPEGDPLPRIKESDGPTPKVILTVVLDGGGWNALRYHPGAWPNIERLKAAGTVYTNATIGSAPAVTGALHATFGTGTYPSSHGLPGNVMRYPDGSIGDVYLDEADPRYLRVPTVSELWDEQTGNKAVVATVSYESWHLGMIGGGAQRATGDRDIAVLWDTGQTDDRREGWWVNERFYRLPEYLRETDFDRLARYERSLDARDGLTDGLWFGHTLGDSALDEQDGKRDEKWYGRSLNEVGEPATRPATPAFASFTGDAVIDILRREGIGEDGITDLLWVELKMPDYAGHAYNVISPEEGDVLREVDRQIGRLRDEMDRIVGSGNYVMAISADHGQEPLPEGTGGWRIDLNEVQKDIEARFGGGVVEQATPADLFLDTRALEELGHTTEDVARYLAGYTVADGIPDGVSRSRLPFARLDDRVFAGVFTAGYLGSLTPDKLNAFGRGVYEEGDLTVGR